MKKLLLLFATVLLMACEPISIEDAITDAEETGQCPDSVGENMLFPDGVLPFYFWYDTLNDKPFPEDRKAIFNQAAKELTAETAITVITYETREEAKSNHANVIRLEMFPFGYGSHIGMTGEIEQEALMGYATDVSDAKRIILTAAGLEYEHRLSGRDEVYDVTVPEEWSDKNKNILGKIDYSVYGSLPRKESIMQIQIYDVEEVEDETRSFDVVVNRPIYLKSEWIDVPLIFYKNGNPVETNTEVAQIDIDRIDFLYNCE